MSKLPTFSDKSYSANKSISSYRRQLPSESPFTATRFHHLDVITPNVTLILLQVGFQGESFLILSLQESAGHGNLTLYKLYPLTFYCYIR